MNTTLFERDKLYFELDLLRDEVSIQVVRLGEGWSLRTARLSCGRCGRATGALSGTLHVRMGGACQRL